MTAKKVTQHQRAIPRYKRHHPDSVATRNHHMGVPSESTLATTLTKTDHHRAILHDLFTLIDRLDRYFDSLATSGGEEDRPEYRENASFSHDARVLREVLSTYSGLLACATLLTRDLVRRQAAISAIPGYESGTPVLYAGTGGNEE